MTHHQEALGFGADTDPADRLLYIWSWLQFLSLAEARGDQRAIGRANFWLARHRLALYRHDGAIAA